MISSPNVIFFLFIVSTLLDYMMVNGITLDKFTALRVDEMASAGSFNDVRDHGRPDRHNRTIYFKGCRRTTQCESDEYCSGWGKKCCLGTCHPRKDVGKDCDKWNKCKSGICLAKPTDKCLNDDDKCKGVCYANEQDFIKKWKKKQPKASSVPGLYCKDELDCVVCPPECPLHKNEGCKPCDINDRCVQHDFQKTCPSHLFGDFKKCLMDDIKSKKEPEVKGGQSCLDDIKKFKEFYNKAVEEKYDESKSWYIFENCGVLKNKKFQIDNKIENTPFSITGPIILNGALKMGVNAITDQIKMSPALVMDYKVSLEFNKNFKSSKSLDYPLLKSFTLFAYAGMVGVVPVYITLKLTPYAFFNGRFEVGGQLKFTLSGEVELEEKEYIFSPNAKENRFYMSSNKFFDKSNIEVPFQNQAVNLSNIDVVKPEEPLFWRSAFQNQHSTIAKSKFEKEEGKFLSLSMLQNEFLNMSNIDMEMVSANQSPDLQVVAEGAISVAAEAGIGMRITTEVNFIPFDIDIATIFSAELETKKFEIESDGFKGLSCLEKNLEQVNLKLRVGSHLNLLEPVIEVCDKFHNITENLDGNSHAQSIKKCAREHFPRATKVGEKVHEILSVSCNFLEQVDNILDSSGDWKKIKSFSEQPIIEGVPVC